MGMNLPGRIALITSLLAAGLTASPNVLFLSLDDLRPDLGCYGVAQASTPHIDRLAAKGRIFTRHYVQAPTCGASRYTLLTGRYGGRGNNALMQRAGRPERTPSLPEVFRAAGYTTVAVGKISHHPGGLAGTNWQDPAAVEMPAAWDRQPLDCGPWQHPEGLMHGLANGAIRGNDKAYPAVQAVEGGAEIYPDGLITNTALDELQTLASDGKPFFLAIGWIRPHLPFGVPKRWLDLHADTPLPAIPHPQKPAGKSTWHGSGEFFRYHHGGRDPRQDAEYADIVRRHYAASVSYADDQVGRVLDALEAHGLAENTVVVVWGDHGWHLGEHAIWGKHALFEESVRAPLIIHHPGIAAPGQSSAAVVETLDVFPTLCELAGLDLPGFLAGSSLKPQLENPAAVGRSAVSYTGAAETIRTDRYRLIRHRATAGQDGFFELYDHQSPAGETRNIAQDHPDVVAELARELDQRLGNTR